MKIKLIHNWMGNSTGNVLDLVEYSAKDLISRGIAQAVKKGRPANSKNQGAPEKNKMIDGSKNIVKG